MTAPKKHKTRFRKNLKQFLDLKESGKLNGQTSSVKAKLKDAAKEIGLDFKKEMKVVKRQTADGKRENPVTFIENSKGKLDFGEISKKIGKEIKRQAGKIRLTKEGFDHIKSHTEEINNIGYDSELKFTEKIIGSFDAIYADRGALLLAIKNKPSKMAIVRLEPFRNEDFYIIKTALPVRPDYFKKKKLLWGTAQSDHRKNATPGAISGHNSSVNKDTKNSDNRKNPETTPQCVVSVQAETDAAKNGIEVRFTGRPPEAVLEKLHEAGFLYWTPEGEPSFWSAKISAKTKKVAEEIAGEFDSAVVGAKQVAGGSKQKAEGEENIINRDKYYHDPFYQTVDDRVINKVTGNYLPVEAGKRTIVLLARGKSIGEEILSNTTLIWNNGWRFGNDSTSWKFPYKTTRKKTAERYLQIMKMGASADELLLLKKPETIRVIDSGKYFLLQTYSERLDTWITQKEHLNKDEAIADAKYWYNQATNASNGSKPNYDAHSIIRGKPTTIDFKADGSVEEKGYFAIAGANFLIASHHKDCSKNSAHFISRAQPRDRSKEALCAQPTFIAKNLNPASITRGNMAFSGAPVVMSYSGHVIQGNGRTIALKIAYDEYPKNAKRYKDYLIEHADFFGFEKDAIIDYKKPVLVRVVQVDKNRAIKLGNVVDTSQAKMSKIDEAKAYIRNLSRRKLEIIGKIIRESDGETIGEIIDDAGMDIIKQLDDLDRTGIVSNNGLTAEGKTFLRSVLVGLVFDSEDHPNALHHYLKLPHTIKAGLERSFGYIIPLIGNKGDITAELANAVEIAAQVKNSDSIETAKEYAHTDDMFEDKSFSKQEIALAQFFLYAGTQKEIRNAFRYYVELLEGKKTLFGETPPKSKKEAFNIVFVEKARPNPEDEAEEIIHEIIVRAQRLQTLGNDNSKELEQLDYLLGSDGWKWNDEETKIIRGNSGVNKEKVLWGVKEGSPDYMETLLSTNPEVFDKVRKKARKDGYEKFRVSEIDMAVPPGFVKTARKNPPKLTDKIKRGVLDDFYAWIKGNPLMDYEPGPTTFANWIQYHYPGYEDQHEKIWAFARPLRANPNARFIYIGICKKISIDNDGEMPILMKHPHAMLTNKAADKLFIVPFSEIKEFDKEVDDMSAEQVFEAWHNYEADHQNYTVNWPDDIQSIPVGTADEIWYASDKIMREKDQKGEINIYHHKFDAGKRPCVTKGNILIVSNLKIDERGILN